MYENHSMKITKSTLALVSLWIVIVPIYSFGYQTALQMRFFCSILCMIYIISHFNSKLLKKTWFIWFYAGITLISSVHNYGIYGISAIMNDFLHPFSVLAIFIIPLIVSEASGINKVAKVFLRCSYVYFIPTMVTVILAGRVDAGWYEPYFVGNKFLLTYYFLVMFCSWGIIHIEEIQYTVKAKVKIIAFCVVGIALSAYLYCTTGVVCYLTVLILMLVIPIRKILEKPLSIAIATVFSGALPISMKMILSIPRINALLLAINETATMNARVRIYEILMSIINKKYWIGYGYNTLIVKECLYSNAQNGMLHIIVQFGMLGAVAFVLLCYIATRNRYKRNKNVVEWCEFWLFALIVAGIIEITFGVFFYVFLALINCATNVKEKRRDENVTW